MKKVLINKEHIEQLNNDNFFNLKNFISSNPNKRGNNYFQRNYNKDFFNKVVNFLQRHEYELLCYRDSSSLMIKKDNVGKLLPRILNGEDIACFEYFETSQLEKKFLQSLVGEDMSVLEGLFWNYTQYNARAFQKYNLFILNEREKELICDLQDKNHELSHQNLSSIKIDFLYEHRNKLIPIEVDKNKMWEEFEDYTNQKAYSPENMFIVKLSAMILLDRNESEIRQLFIKYSTSVRDKEVLKYLKRINPKVLPQVYDTIIPLMQQIEEKQNSSFELQESNLTHKTFKFNIKTVSQKHQLGESTVTAAVDNLFYVLINIKAGLLHYTKNVKGEYWITCIGEESLVDFCRQTLSETLNDKNLIKNKNNKREILEKKLEKFMLERNLDCPHKDSPKRINKL